MRMVATLALLACLLLPACHGADQEPPSSWSGRTLSTLVHPSGLRIELPADVYEVEETATGWQIRPADAAQLRAPFEIRVALAAGARPAGEWPEHRRLDGRDFRYRIDHVDGGSGGDIQVLHAWEETQGEAYLTLQQTVQAEPLAQPDFADGWAILERARRP
jgi:hypothetical protein